MMSMANDSTMSTASPYCIFEYIHDKENTNDSVFTPKMTAINNHNDYFMVSEETEGLGTILVSVLNYSDATATCYSKIKFVMIEKEGMSFTYRSFQTETVSDDSEGDVRV